MTKVRSGAVGQDVQLAIPDVGVSAGHGAHGRAQQGPEIRHTAGVCVGADGRTARVNIRVTTDGWADPPPSAYDRGSGTLTNTEDPVSRTRAVWWSGTVAPPPACAGAPR
jgi:hypothetical protein